MPFKEPWKNFKEGDFIFGINAQIAAFQQKHNVPKASIIDPVGTVRQLADNRTNLENFEGFRREQNSAYLESLENHPKYQLAYNRDKTPGSTGSNAQFRLKSKAGLNFCISSNIPVHFILDELKLKQIIEKNFTDPKKLWSPNNEFKNSDADKIRSVTGAELRWIYRNRDRPETQECVQFWFKGTQCCPPWEPAFRHPDSQASDWNAYKPKTVVG